MIELQEVDFSYGKTPLLSRVSLRFEKGLFYGLFGPNGSGKSTILKVITGELKPRAGTLVPRWESAVQRARTIALVEQEIPVNIPLTVREVVALGRYPWSKGERTSAAVQAALQLLSLEEISEKRFFQLSGGERQRVMLARALAQDTPILLLDEPTSALDWEHQHLFYRILKKLAASGKCVIMVSHDFFIAPRYIDRAILVRSGRVYQQGPPAEILNEESLQQLFSGHDGKQERAINFP